MHNRSGVVFSSFLEGLSRPNEKPPVFFNYLFSSPVCFFCHAFLSQSGFFLWPFFFGSASNHLPRRHKVPGCLLGQKRTKPKSRVFPPAPCKWERYWDNNWIMLNIELWGNFSEKTKHSSTAKRQLFGTIKNKIKPRILRVVMCGSSRRKCGGRVSCVRFHQKQENKMCKLCFDWRKKGSRTFFWKKSPQESSAI